MGRRNLMNEKLVWMTEKDLHKIMRAVNLAAMMGDQVRNGDFTPIDIDGDPVSAEAIEDGLNAIEEASFALSRAKYVPEDVLPKLELILMSG